MTISAGNEQWNDWSDIFKMSPVNAFACYGTNYFRFPPISNYHSSSILHTVDYASRSKKAPGKFPASEIFPVWFMSVVFRAVSTSNKWRSSSTSSARCWNCAYREARRWVVSWTYDHLVLVNQVKTVQLTQRGASEWLRCVYCPTSITMSTGLWGRGAYRLCTGGGWRLRVHAAYRRGGSNNRRNWIVTVEWSHCYM